MDEVGPGLRRWTAYHPEWKEDVGCLACDTDDGLVLVDPLVPDDLRRTLDREVKRAGGRVHVLVTVYWHTRGARELAERYGARVWTASRARAAIERRAGTVTDVYRPGDALPGGIRAFPSGRGAEVVFWLPEHRALVVGDVLLGSPLRLCPPSWLHKGVTHGDVRKVLAPLLELPVRRVLVSHGKPVLGRGRAALAAVLERK